jgi:hypothetical protein
MYLGLYYSSRVRIHKQLLYPVAMAAADWGILQLYLPPVDLDYSLSLNHNSHF